MIFNSIVESIIVKYYSILCEIAVLIAANCTKGDTFTCNTSCAEITFKIK